MPVEFLPGFFEPPVSPDIVQGEVAYDNASNVSATLPATATTGNLLLAKYFYSAADGTAPTLPAAPTGYTEVYSETLAGSNWALWYKISDGTEDTVDIGAAGACLFFEITGASTQAPVVASTTRAVTSTTGIRVPAAGTIAVTPTDALVLGFYGYTDGDHNGSTVSHDTPDGNSDFYMGIRGSVGGEEFHIFVSWAEVSDQSAQSVTYDPSNATSEGNLGSLVVIALADDQPSPTVLEVDAEIPNSPLTTNVPAVVAEVVVTDVNETIPTEDITPAVIEIATSIPATSITANVPAVAAEVAVTDVNEPAEAIIPAIIEIVGSTPATITGTNPPAVTIEATVTTPSSPITTNLAPVVIEVAPTQVNEILELSVETIVEGIFAHQIDGYRVDDILRILFAVAAGDVELTPNGNYTIYKPLDDQVRVTGEPAPNNGRDVTSIDLTP